MVLTKIRCGFLNFGKIHHCTQWGNQKPQLSGKQEIVERNGVQFGAVVVDSSLTGGTFGLLAFKVIRCTFDFSSFGPNDKRRKHFEWL